MNKMSLLVLNIKQILKRKISVVSIILMGLLIVFFYISNMMKFNMEMKDPSISINQEIVSLNQDIDTFISKINNTTDKDEIDILKDDLNTAKERKELLENKIDSFNKKDYKKYYLYEEQLNDMLLQASNYEINQVYYDDELVQVLKENKAYYQYKQENDPTLDSRFFAVQGVPFFLESMNNYLFTCILFVLVFVCSIFFCSKRKGLVEIENVYPVSFFKKYLCSVSSCLIYAIMIFLSSVFIMIGLSFCHGLGGSASPLAIYNLEGFVKYIGLKDVFGPLCIMIILDLIFVINCVFLISRICKKSINCLIVSLIVVLGGIFLSMQIVPLYGIAEWIPFTYLNLINVLTNKTSFLLNNESVSCSMGIIMLLVWNVVLMIVILESRKRIS